MAIFLDGPINDGGWGASCYKAMTDAADALGWDTAYSESVATADWATTMENYIDQGYDLIFAPGNQYTDAVKQVAKDYPDAHFCILNDTVKDTNIESLMPNTQQIGLLAGALAGILSKTNNIGFIGGVELDTTKDKLENYTKAAQKIEPGHPGCQRLCRLLLRRRQGQGDCQLHGDHQRRRCHVRRRLHRGHRRPRGALGLQRPL